MHIFQLHTLIYISIYAFTAYAFYRVIHVCLYAYVHTHNTFYFTFYYIGYMYIYAHMYNTYNEVHINSMHTYTHVLRLLSTYCVLGTLLWAFHT